MFEGHQFIKLLDNTWVFDLTEYEGYKVKVGNDNEVISFKEAFSAEVVGNEIIFTKKTRTPLKVLREAANQIRNYEKELGTDID